MKSADEVTSKRERELEELAIKRSLESVNNNGNSEASETAGGFGELLQDGMSKAPGQRETLVSKAPLRRDADTKYQRDADASLLPEVEQPNAELAEAIKRSKAHTSGARTPSPVFGSLLASAQEADVEEI